MDVPGLFANHHRIFQPQKTDSQVLLMTQPSTLDQRTRHFAKAMQSALTRAEVASAFLGTARDVIDSGAIGLFQMNAESGHVEEMHGAIGLHQISTDARNGAAVPVDLPVAFVDEYETIGRPDDPVLDHVIQAHAPIDSSRLGSGTWERSGARAALRVGGFEHSMEAPIVVRGRLVGTINFARAEHQAPFAIDDLTAAGIVAEHLSLAIERAKRFDECATKAVVYENALDRLPQGMVIADLDGSIVYRNRAALRDCIRPSADGGITEVDPVSQAIAVVSSQFRSDGKRVSVQKIDDGRNRLLLKTFRLADRADSTVTLIFSLNEQTDHRLPNLSILTEREQEIAQLVSEGLTTKQIASRAFISDNTVKQHLKRIFTKTDVNNRAELVQLIWRSTPQI